MAISITQHQGITIVVNQGRLDTNSSPAAEEAINAAIDAGANQLIVDFSQTDYISSAGLRVLLKTVKTLKPKNGALVLCSANEQIHEVLEISGFLGMMQAYENLDEALSSLQKA